MKQIGYLIGFAVVCVAVLMGSTALMQQDAADGSSLPTVGAMRPTVSARNYTVSTSVYVPLRGNNPSLRMRMSSPVSASVVVPSSGVSASAGRVFAGNTPSTVRSYGGSMAASGLTSQVVSGSSSRVATPSGLAVPQVAPRTIAMRDNRMTNHRAVVRQSAPQHKASPYKAPHRATMASPLASATAMNSLSLGYESAAAYMGSRSPMKAPPGANPWGNWLEGWTKEHDLGTDENGRIIVNRNEAYQAWLEKFGLVDTPDQQSQFDTWFNSQTQYVWMPIGDALPFVLLMALVYALYIIKRKKKQQIV